MSITIDTRTGPVVNSDGPGDQPLRQDRTGALVTSDGHARYSEPLARGGVFSLSVAAAAAITAYAGAAAGTPQIAVWNPTGSGKNLFLLQAAFANVVAASAAGTVTWGLYYGQTVAITQATVVAPTNMATLNATGSVATGFSAVALTSSTALTRVLPLGWYYWATGAGAFGSSGMVDIAGSIMIPPGSMAALGGTAALTAATWISSLTWEEISI